MTFAEALTRARHVTCSDKEGVFTCHTVDPYVDLLEKAHQEELEQIKAKVAWIDTKLVTHPWTTVGKGIYTGDDMGSLLAEVDGPSELALVAAACVNAVVEVKKLLGIKKEGDLNEPPL